MFQKILIANRGEIALRIIRACKQMGISTVAVYSEADKDSSHVQVADEAICIGGPKSSSSYLNIPAIISAAEISDVEAIHPGYGFLAENAHFAEICESCGIKFIGPTPEVIKLLGDKMAAKDTMVKAGLPTIPGSKEIVRTKEEGLKIAKSIGYPVIIKASAGGGGRGMRVAHNDVRFVSAFMTAQSEAEAAFSNSSVYIEKYFEKPRHVEVQILGDSHGNVIHLGERDCTVQRRHQKLVEETPCCKLDSESRKRLTEVAVLGAKAANYTNAGTIEFLLDTDGKFYFMEMNTRVQVEHCVTEVVTGVDIIKEQIRIAYGKKLSYAQNDIKFNGAAIECRINAEDPDSDFMPCPGKVNEFRIPGGFGIRLDTHVYPGYVIPPFYDSMIAKIIAHGNDRKDAINNMLAALDEFKISPIKTTIGFHKRLLNSKYFVDGNIDTNFVEWFLKESGE